MKSRLKGALRYELRAVHVSESLKMRILAEAGEGRFHDEPRKHSIVPLAVAAALILVLGMTLGLASLRVERPDHQHSQVYSHGSGGEWVWVWDGDALYHDRADCGLMSDAHLERIASARAAGRAACGLCVTGGQTKRIALTVNEQEGKGGVETVAATPVFRSEAEDEKLSTEELEFTEVCSEVSALDAEAPTAVPTVLPTPMEENVVMDSMESGSAAHVEEAIEHCWTTNQDAYFHSSVDCAAMAEGERICGDVQNAVEAWEKEPCPKCMADIREKYGYDLEPEERLCFVDQAGGYFHENANCGEIVDSKKLQGMTLEDVLAKGIGACQMCVEWLADNVEAPFWATDSGICYHLKKDCLGMRGAYLMLQSAAEAMDKAPCPVCGIRKVWTNERKEIYHFNKNCVSADEWIWEIEAIEREMILCVNCAEAAMVWAAPGGTFMHTVENCTDMRGAAAMSPQEAAAMGKQLCPVCIGSEGAYVSEKDGFYHASDCQSLQKVKSVLHISVREAQELGYSPCTLCMAAQEEYSAADAR